MFSRCIDVRRAALPEKVAQRLDVLAAGKLEGLVVEVDVTLAVFPFAPPASAVAISNNVLPLLQPAMSAYSYLSLKPREPRSLRQNSLEQAKSPTPRTRRSIPATRGAGALLVPL
jgi:hypothetical protein